MKAISSARGAANIKSAHSIGARSIPKVQRSNYLELYMLGSEKSRLEKEISSLDRRKAAVKKQLDSITNRIEKLRAEIDKEQPVKPCRSLQPGPLKRIGINY